VNTPQRDRFEQLFAPFLDRARALPAVVWDAVETNSGPSVEGDSFPEVTGVGVMLAVGPLYEGAVQSLREPSTTLTALALLRPLIEAWACLHFIMGKDMTGAQCRAIRVELGWAKELVSVMRSGDDPGDLERAVRRLAEIEEIKLSRGCTAGAWKYGHADQQVQKLASTPGLDWLLSMWRTSSQMVHVGGWDWSLESRGDGTSDYVLPTPSHRASRLNHLLVIYHGLASTYMAIHGLDGASDAARDFRLSAGGLLGEVWLRRMIDGDFD
jgi:hypothetical protein